MAGNRFGTLFAVTTFGESHGPALGCVVDGCPAGVPLELEHIRSALRRRRPGSGGASTARAEADEPELLSGVFEGKTLGTPIAVLVRNTGSRSEDYDNLKDCYRPGHADWTWEAKYGLRDHRGGGRSSGRETLCRVAAGAVAAQFLSRYGIVIRAWSSAIGGITAAGMDDPAFSLDEAEANPLRVPCAQDAARIAERISALRAQGDSAGGTVSCAVTGVPPGLGEPVFGKLDALLASAMLSIGAAKGIEFGAGFGAARSTGSAQNDRLMPTAERLPSQAPAARYETNNAGGVLGGIATGMALLFTVAFKPVPSITRAQKTIDRTGAEREILIKGRHDICVVPRAVPVVEAMAALVLADLMLLRRADRHQPC
ncbi:MAG: chorismate synthase [Spirochaetaceae bacterium]|jgi:chorismate synthase|nr:chorismate synthase [Spirochaetaceae bacterium]